MVINTAEATIQTFTVAVKVIRIGKRQMTQAVFRQLPMALPLSKSDERWVGPPLEREDGRWVWNGNLWGTVNYFWKDCDPELAMHNADGRAVEHLHLVWEREGTLYRSCMYPWGSYFTNRIDRPKDAVWNKHYRVAKQLNQLFIAA